jgi:hypothetical protein
MEAVLSAGRTRALLASQERARQRCMLKTTVDSPARFGALSKGLITYAILSEYVHHPLMSLMGTAMTLGRFKRGIAPHRAGRR